MILKIFPVLLVINFFSISYSQSNEPADFSKSTGDAKTLEFYFYKNKNTKPQLYGLSSSGINIEKRLTVFIIHDHKESREAEWVEKLKVEVLKKSFQVVTVDWSKAAGDPDKAKDNTKFVGDKVATFIGNTKLDSTTVIVVGLGMGAQIAGLAGKAYQSQNSGQKFVIIVALDPAASGFEVEKGSKKQIPDSNKLTATDAKIVSCTHTNCQKYGVKAPICTIDYYANNGNVQGGCTGDKMDPCSHTRAAELFIESFKVRGVKATEASVTVFKNKVDVNQKSSKTEFYGLNIGPTSKGVYQLKTKDKPPYLT